jgi:hypothetical protein
MSINHKCTLCKCGTIINVHHYSDTFKIYQCNNTDLIQHATWAAPSYKAYRIETDAMWIRRNETDIRINWNSFLPDKMVNLRYSIPEPKSIEELRKFFENIKLLT